MILSITGFGYLSLALGLGVFGYRCFESWKSDKRPMAKVFYYFFFIFSMTSLTIGLVSILGNTNVTTAMFIFKDVLFAIGCGTLGYLIIYFVFPKINPWFGFTPIFMIGVVSLSLNLFIAQPFITKSGEINWGVLPLGYILQFSMFLFTFLPMSLILLQQSKISKNSFLQAKALLFSLVAFGGFLVGFIELIIEPLFNLEETLVNEFTLVGLNVALFTFLLTSHRDFESDK